MQTHLGFGVSDNNRYQAAIASSQIECDVIGWVLTVPIPAFFQSGKKFTLVVEHFGALFALEFCRSFPSIRIENLVKRQSKTGKIR